MSRSISILLMMVLFLLAQGAKGEAGFSEILNSRSLWIEKPYALTWSGDHDIGHFSVDLSRAESVPIWHPLDWYFSEDGLNSTEHLVSEITGFTRDRDLFLMRLDPNWGQKGAFAVLDLTSGVVTNLPTDSDFRGFLIAHGLSLDKLEFRTFDDQYRKRKIIMTVQAVATILSILIMLTAFIVMQRRKKAKPMLPGKIV